MAVCKGILEIDPEHRDTLEMLATLAQRRATRRGTTKLEQIDGKWVAEPTGGGESRESTQPGAAPRAEPEPLGVGEPDPSLLGDEPENPFEAGPRTDPSIPISLAVDPPPPAPLDFPLETKQLAPAYTL